MRQNTNELKVSFNLKDAQGWGKTKSTKKKVKTTELKATPIIILIRWGYKEKGKYTAIKYSTGKSILPNHWNYEKQESRVNLSDVSEDSNDFNISLLNDVKKVRNAYKSLSGQIVTPDKFRAQLDYHFGRGKNPNSGTPTNMNEYIETYIQEMKSGKRTNKGKLFAPRTISNTKTAQLSFNEYQISRNITLDFQDINFEFERDFRAYLVNEKKYKVNTIGRYISSIKTIMKASFRQKLHTNIDYEQFTTGAEKSVNVSLTEKEVEALYKLKLSGEMEIVRDLFLVGCYTLQRWSDFSRIRKEYIIEEEGQTVIKLNQQKTGTEVLIPIHPVLDTILKKYKYTLPKYADRKFRDVIKDVCKLAEIDKTFIKRYTKGGIRNEDIKKKYELVGTHTARRTGCTIWYDNEIPTYYIMKVSGHKTEKEFLKYIDREGQKVAKVIYATDYFRNSQLKVAR